MELCVITDCKLKTMISIYIKNMVCDRCKTAVRHAVEKAGLHPNDVVLGEVTLAESKISRDQYRILDEALKELGFERIDNRKARIIESIKNTVINRIHYSEITNKKLNWPSVLTDEIHYEYNYLSNLFSSVEGITLEQYIIRQKIERAKELLFYDEFNLSEIAVQLGYSSVAHLSAQFKKITGVTPSELKRAKKADLLRKSLDTLSGD